MLMFIDIHCIIISLDYYICLKKSQFGNNIFDRENSLKIEKII